jgi:hypothetical protein
VPGSSTQLQRTNNGGADDRRRTAFCSARNVGWSHAGAVFIRPPDHAIGFWPVLSWRHRFGLFPKIWLVMRYGCCTRYAADRIGVFAHME